MTTSAGTDSCISACPFCHPAPERIVFENPVVIALWDAFPVNRGHVLIVPRRHVPSWFDASAEERVALMAAVDEARGGVRRVIPAKGNYRSPPSTSSGRTVTPEAGRKPERRYLTTPQAILAPPPPSAAGASE